jgi:hypothetical protein
MLGCGEGKRAAVTCHHFSLISMANSRLSKEVEAVGEAVAVLIHVNIDVLLSGLGELEEAI